LFSGLNYSCQDTYRPNGKYSTVISHSEKKKVFLPKVRHVKNGQRKPMAYKTISDEEMLTRALELFRAYGFDGVSLKQLADAMGLEKAALYYRFPGGKDEIALAVVRAFDATVRERVFKPLHVAATSPRRRVQAACELLREFYAGGEKSCALDVMSIQGATEAVKKTLRGLLQAWIEAFMTIAREAGLTAAQARLRAEEAVLKIEGSLIVARVLNDKTAFERTLRELPHFLTVGNVERRGDQAS
jgi:TetR/AcrR family transcriptional regulator, lmrAB and yxaGH operons repressor